MIFVEEFKLEQDEVVIDKSGFSAFYQTGLEQLLTEQRVTHLILMGSPPSAAYTPRCGMRLSGVFFA